MFCFLRFALNCLTILIWTVATNIVRIWTILNRFLHLNHNFTFLSKRNEKFHKKHIWPNRKNANYFYRYYSEQRKMSQKIIPLYRLSS